MIHRQVSSVCEKEVENNERSWAKSERGGCKIMIL